MHILFVASLHHPQELIAARAATPPDQPMPLFPPSMGQYHWEQAFRRRGYTLAAFYRNLPVWGAQTVERLREQRHSRSITPAKVAAAIANRLPPRLDPDKRARNANLIAQARAFKPDVVWLVGDNTIIYPETLQALKDELGCKVVYASGTSPIVFSHPIEREAARLYDLVLVNDFYHGIQWEELGAPQVVNLPIAAIDPVFHHPYALTDAERAEYTCEIAFVGTLVPDNLYRRRVEALLALREFDLGIWTVHDVPPELQPYVRGRALGETMLRIMSAAKLTINTHGDFMRYGGNMRLFEAAAVGVCQIADDLPGVRQWFTPEEHLLTYRDMPHLQQQVRRALADDGLRARLATSAQAHVYAHHTYDARVLAFERQLQ
ncbi:MAG: CgeB family protein [Phototrophicaceae bacterium]